MQNEFMSSNLGQSPDVPGLFSIPTFYTILNVDQNASRMMIREAYLRVKNMYQSGQDGLYGIAGSEDFARQTAEIEEAFAVLNDDVRRQEYDRSLQIVNQPKGSSYFDGNHPQTTKHTANHSFALGNSHDQHLAETIQTNRSTLKVIKTRALKADDEGVQNEFKSILTEADLGDGATLNRLRLAANVSENEMQERTKISLEYIRGMEANRFDRLPQVVFVKGFMRSYLKYLCVPNPEAIISSFAARVEAWQQGHKQ
jgi:DnaJ-class molecular chaperone